CRQVEVQGSALVAQRAKQQPGASAGTGYPRPEGRRPSVSDCPAINTPQPVSRMHSPARVPPDSLDPKKSRGAGGI
ncbi:hypothetical protein, partial [Marinobacter salarius]|uniref:hypothetical protein n=1 Tax=Marinobacter salarius TaxID=1420917 RepID=UPI001D004F96